MIMKIVDKIENVGHYEVYKDFVFIGRDTRIKNGMISNGNQILKKSKDRIEILREGKYFYFTAFKEGFLFYVNEGEPIFYSTGSINIKVTPKKHYFSPLQSFQNLDEVVITEMDEEFNQKYYFLDSLNFENRRECKIYPQLRSDRYYCRFHRKESWVEIVDKHSDFSYRKVGIHLDKDLIHKNGKPLLDENILFIPLKEGRVAKFNCDNDNIEWINKEFEEQYVSYSCNTKFLYQHFGKGVNQILKTTGETVNQIIFKDSLNENYHSSGGIWCSDKFIITKDLMSGKFCVIGADTMEVLNLEFLMKQGFTETRNSIQILENKIFVLGKDNVLREYQMN